MRTPSFTSSKREYTDIREMTQGAICNLYLARTMIDGKPRRVILKMADDIRDNDLVENEGKILTYLNHDLRDAKRPIRLLIPDLLDTFEVEGQQVNVIDFAAGYYTFEEVRQYYPDGVPPEHVAWMFNRLLMALIAAHPAGVVHGAVLPCHMLIFSGTKRDEMRHTGVLIDWSYAVKKEGESWPRLTAMNEDYAAFYPPEVQLRQSVSPATDLAMAAACAQYLLGGNVKTQEVPESTPRAMAQLLESCRAKKPDQRPHDLPDFYRRFQRMLEQQFGPPKFVELPLPPRSE